MASQSAITSRNIVPAGIKAFTDICYPCSVKTAVKQLSSKSTLVTALVSPNSLTQ